MDASFNSTVPGGLLDASNIFSLEHEASFFFDPALGTLDNATEKPEMICEFCGESSTKKDEMIFHVHLWHQVMYSQECPCDACIAIGLPLDLHMQLMDPMQGVMDEAALLATSSPTFTGQADDTFTAQNMFETATQPRLIGMLNASAAAQASSMSYAGQSVQSVDASGSALGAPIHLTNGSALIPVRPARVQQQPLARPPDFSYFTRPQPGSIRENNLPYSMSLIEAGKYNLTPSGQASWRHNNTIAPIWNPTGTDPVRSASTGRIMRYLPFIPEHIPMSTLGWQLYTYVRSGTTQTPPVEVRYDDLYDRMDRTMTHSALSNRISKWLAEVGGLPMNVCINYNWPSRHSIKSVSKLTWEQARLNTWWDVQYLHAEDVYIVRQPDMHPGYLKRWTTPEEEAPYYFIEDCGDRKISEQVQMIADAILFLEIKAEESGIHTGIEGLLSWFSSRVADADKEQLDLGILLEFQRWRQGCPETPSISEIRTALDNVSSQVEYDAIMAGEYRWTLALQLSEHELENARMQRKAQDAAMAGKAQEKADLRSKRAGAKRAADDGTEMVSQGGKKRTRKG